MIAEPDWIESQTHVSTHFWSFHAGIPAANLGHTRLQAGHKFHTAVCRYHYVTPQPVLSSTAALPTPFFHHHEGWHALILTDESG